MPPSASSLNPIHKFIVGWKSLKQHGPSILHRFQHLRVFEPQQLISSSRFPFRHLVQSVTIERQCALPATTVLHKFPKLNALDITVDWNMEENKQFDITPVLSLVAPRLHSLSLCVEGLPSSSAQLPAAHGLTHLRTALKLCTELTTLNVRSLVDIQHDVSYLYSMQKLQSINYSSCSPAQSLALIAAVRALPNVKQLTLSPFYSEQDLMDTIRQLCAQPGAPAQLEQLTGLFGLSAAQQASCAQLLSQLPALNNIHFFLGKDLTPLPTAFSKWLQKLTITKRNISHEDMLAMISLPNLSSLQLINCALDSTRLQQLIQALSPKLKHLKIRSNIKVELSFNTISLCRQLETVHLEGVSGLRADHFDSLLQCTQLASIEIVRCDDWNEQVKQLSTAMKHALKRHSSVFPNLTRVNIDSKSHVLY